MENKQMGTDEIIVSTVKYLEKVVIATNKHVYVMGDDFVMRRVVFETEEKEVAPCPILKGYP
jgi:hypothetical protein